MVIDILCTSLVNQALNWTNEQERQTDGQTDRGRQTEGERQRFSTYLYFICYSKESQTFSISKQTTQLSNKWYDLSPKRRWTLKAKQIFKELSLHNSST